MTRDELLSQIYNEYDEFFYNLGPPWEGLDPAKRELWSDGIEWLARWIHSHDCSAILGDHPEIVDRGPFESKVSK